MAEIIPSIIAANFEELETKLVRIEGLVKWAELDIMDGVFVPNVSWQTPADLKEIDGKIKLSAHFMVESPETIIEDWIDYVDRIVVHFESTEDIESVIKKFITEDHHHPCELGLALELSTPLEKIYPYLDRIKTVQLMSIQNLGYYGEKFDSLVIERVKTLHENWPDVKIIIDGGIDLENAKEVLVAGASGLVVGSDIWEAPDLEEALENFQNL